MEENYNLSITQIKNSIKENSLILFVGAGISANSNLPTWGELIQSLKKELNLRITLCFSHFSFTIDYFTSMLSYSFY